MLAAKKAIVFDARQRGGGGHCGGGRYQVRDTDCVYLMAAVLICLKYFTHLISCPFQSHVTHLKHHSYLADASSSV